jgi:hypothetical protein
MPTTILSCSHAHWPNNALQRTEAGGGVFPVLHALLRQPPSLSLDSLGPLVHFMFGSRSELKIPPAAKADPASSEILRVWLAGGSQHISLKADAWDDPAAWGLLLADLAHHVANAYVAAGQHTQQQAYQRVLAGLSAELQSPTDTPTGGLSA